MIATCATLVADWREWLPELLPGLWVAVKLTVASLAIGYPLGLLLAVCVESRTRALRWVALAIVELGRGIPILVLLYLVYFGAPQAGVTFGAFLAALIALAFSTAAYSSEIFRGGLLAIPKGQHEAARAIGLSPWDQYRLVILPQALRVIVPPLVGFSIIMLQMTSIAFAIALPELMSRAYNLGNLTFKYLSVLVLAALLYACVVLPLSQLVAWLERRRSLIASQARHPRRQ